MFNVFSVNYDLRVRGTPDYVGLEAELKRSARWWHYLKSTWLVLTDETANELWERLRPHVRREDSILIIEVRDNTQGWLPRDAWRSIGENVPLPVA